MTVDIQKLKALAETAAEDQRHYLARAELAKLLSPAAVLELITELEGYRMGAKAEADAGDEARAEVRKLKAENESLRKDAERYRWFRAQHWDSSAICAVVDPKTSTKLGAYCPSADLLDSAIDTAISLSKEARP